jgi:FkbM family methyltransferase
MYEGAKRARYYWDVLTRQKIGDIEFKLWVKGGHLTGQKVYLDLEKGKDPYEQLMVEALRSALDVTNKPVFMDIGAFMGYFACYVSSYTKGQFPVYVAESNPDYTKVIRKTVKENGFLNMHVFDAVLSDKEEILSVYKESVTKDNPRGKKLQGITLDGLCRENAIMPNILKVDVDGSEGKVFNGAKKILKESVNFILLEFHPDDYLQRCSDGITRQEILSLLEGHGFKNYLIGGFRFKRSPEMEKFKKTGLMSYVEITPENKELLFFDRFIDLFMFSVKNHDIRSLKGFGK